MKFVLIPDSFKGTLSSEQICEIAKEKVEKHFPGAETACVPVADGGEGSRCIYYRFRRQQGNCKG